jgi:UDP-3-O-acyl N-acetylglucosamine deacetylase
MEHQFTLTRPTTILRGNGLHTGRQSAVRLWPAPAGTGLVFRRSDLPGTPDIPALVGSVESTVRCVALAKGGARVSTVEHVLAACSLSGLDNAVISVEGDELPAGDGSALLFLDMLEAAGLTEQGVARNYMFPARRIEAGAGGARVSADPSAPHEIRFRFSDGGKYGGREAVLGKGVNAAREVASARTFCYEDEIEALRAKGLGQGGSLDNVLVLRRDGSSVNEPRGEMEPVMHKLLDLIGDLALAGAPVRAGIIAEGTGHAQHVEFVRALVGASEKKEAGLTNA